MTVRRLLAIVFGTLAVFAHGCGRPSMRGSALLKPSDIVSESEDGFRDLVFSTAEPKKLVDGSQMIRASGFYKGQQVGFELVLSSTWQEGKDSPPLTRGTVTLRSLGTESDKFLKAVDENYRAEVNPGRMKPQTVFAAIVLGGNPLELSRGAAKLKLMFETQNERRYAELYITIDVIARKLYVQEKEPGYRKAIVRALAAD
jgi:hypothetical protein